MASELSRAQILQNARNALYCVSLVGDEHAAKDIHDKGTAAVDLLEREVAALTARCKALEQARNAIYTESGVPLKEESADKQQIATLRQQLAERDVLEVEIARTYEKHIKELEAEIARAQSRIPPR